ncbi:MAG: ABC transporter substrate-binding protein [Methylophilaceae bacterium]
MMLVISSLAFAELSPDTLVRKMTDDVIYDLKKNKDTQSGDRKKIHYQLIEKKILPNFDFVRISRLVLGKHWRSMSDAQKNQFTIEFKYLLIRTYSIALSKYTNQTIVFKPLRKKDSAKIVTVKTNIIQNGSQPIAVNYVLSNSTGHWLIFDIVIEHVSLITNYRSQFSEEIRKSSVDKLLQKLVKKNNANN